MQVRSASAAPAPTARGDFATASLSPVSGASSTSEAMRVDDPRVGRDDVARAHEQQVARHELRDARGLRQAVADHLGAPRLRLAPRLEQPLARPLHAVPDRGIETDHGHDRAGIDQIAEQDRDHRRAEQQAGREVRELADRERQPRRRPPAVEHVGAVAREPPPGLGLADPVPCAGAQLGEHHLGLERVRRCHGLDLGGRPPPRSSALGARSRPAGRKGRELLEDRRVGRELDQDAAGARIRGDAHDAGAGGHATLDLPSQPRVAVQRGHLDTQAVGRTRVMDERGGEHAFIERPHVPGRRSKSRARRGAPFRISAAR